MNRNDCVQTKTESVQTDSFWTRVCCHDISAHLNHIQSGVAVSLKKKMFSAFKRLVTRLFGNEEDFGDKTKRLEEILREINLKEENDNHVLGEILKNSVEDDEGPAEKKLGEDETNDEYDVKIYNCSHKTGKVTYICDEYGLIDKNIYFDISKVTKSLKLTEGDDVAYMSYKENINSVETVYKIYALKNDSWEINDNEFKKDVVVAAMPMVVNGRVTQKKGRELFIEPVNVWCSLEKITATYIPIEGDWVSLEVTAAINKDKVNLAGDIMEIKSLTPLLAKSGYGRITFWSDSKQEGAIENQILFHKKYCISGYLPALGDEVAYEALESDLGNYRWRALSVSPKENFVMSETQFKIQDIRPLMEDKNEISILPQVCCVNVELNRVTEASFQISNSGSLDKILINVRLQQPLRKSQIKLIGPKLNDGGLRLRPNETCKINFECHGEFLGTSEEMCIFQFNSFKIVRLFSIVVGSTADMREILDCKAHTAYYKRGPKVFVRNDFTSGTTLFGPKPWQRPKFITGEQQGCYKVPKKLWDILLGDSDYVKRKEEIVKDLEEYAPYLTEDLSASYYADRFHLLLYLEEIAQKDTFTIYNRKSVFLYRNGDYLTLGIPKLSEQKPSLIVGDKVIIKQPWSDVNKDICHVGYIYEVRQNEILIKFHEYFHQSYDESECDVTFEPSTGQICKAHDAVNRAVKKLGRKWLFPTAVNEKPPQIDFTLDDDCFDMNPVKETLELNANEISNFECDINEDGYIIRNSNNGKIKKKLIWFNQDLNHRQKLAVINILKGHGRPLPYIIFGPPGTGKTITIVEAIMQIYHLIPESRILVTTPSNSSADLLCERLIEMGKFKPGQLVRLIAYYKAVNDSVPSKLIPYCTLIDIFENCNKPRNHIEKRGNFLVSSYSQLVGRHRITISTCACVGSLHQMPFPPGHFTHIMVDEAGQATEPDVLISTTFQNIANGQVVLVGDPQQLGPVCLSNLALKYGLGVSLMQRLLSCFPYQKDFDTYPQYSGYDPRFITRLNVNYRSVPEILTLPSQMFYDSELIPTVSQTNGCEADIIDKFNFSRGDVDKPAAIIFHGIIGENYQEPDTPSWFNPHEVWQAVIYLKKLYDIGLKCSDIGIITPYNKQIQKLRIVLNALNLALPKIGTVEDFQGQERHIIIMSAVRSSATNFQNKDIRQSLGFVSCPKRLNVAITRSRALLIILGNPLILSKDIHWKTVFDYCRNNNSYTGCSILKLDVLETCDNDEGKVTE